MHTDWCHSLCHACCAITCCHAVCQPEPRAVGEEVSFDLSVAPRSQRLLGKMLVLDGIQAPRSEEQQDFDQQQGFRNRVQRA